LFKKNTTKSQFAKIAAVNILFLILIVGYSYGFYQWHLKNDKIIEHLHSVKNDLADIRKQQHKFLNRELFDEQFFDVGENQYSGKLKQNINSVIEHVVSLQEASANYKDNEILLVYDNIRENLQDLNISNDLLMKYLKEAGNERFGIYSHLLVTEKACEEKINDLPASSVVRTYFNQAKKYREIFYLFSDLRVLNLLNTSVDAGISSIEQNKSLTAKYKYLRVIDQLNEYKKVINQYARKVMQIGVNDAQGIRLNITKSYERINLRIDKIIVKIEQLQIRANRISFAIIVFLVLLSLILSFYFHYQSTKGIQKFIAGTEKYFKSWLNGTNAKAPENLPNDDYLLLQALMNDFSEKLNLSVQMLKALMRSDARLLTEENYEKTIFPEIKAIDKHIRSLNRQLKAETKATLVNEWIRKGLTGFSEVLRKNFDEPTKHAKEILSNLVSYLNVPMGAIYLPSSEKRNTFDLVGSIAFGKEKHYVRSVMLGEGIVGTVAKEKKTLNITDIPEDYFRVSSGFGEAKPKNIIVIPIKLENKVFGIIELASLQKFQQFELEFIDELSKTLGASFAISRIFRNTRNKLEKAENQLMALRREKRACDEKRKELEKENLQLQNIKNENEIIKQGIDTLMLSADLDLEGNILDINNAFAELLKKSKDILLHSNYWDYTYPCETIEDDMALDKLKNTLRIGKMQSMQQHFKVVNKEVSLSVIFIPFRNLDGKTYKIRVLAWNNSVLLVIENELNALKQKIKEASKEIEIKNIKIEELEKDLEEKDKKIGDIRKLYEEDIKKIKSEHLRAIAKNVDEHKKKEAVLFDQIAQLREEIERLKNTK